jgi:soluble lytic murein transglycosylase-like protein
MTRYRKEIIVAAQKYELDPLLVEAIVLTESAGNTDGFRFEPAFYNRYMKPMKMHVGKNPRRISSSYGLMQIMYQVALERGYPTCEPPEGLFIPEVGLDYGCKQLRMLVDWASEFPTVTDQQRVEAVLASYNGGRGGNKPTDKPLRNASYVRKVLANLSLLKTGLAA